MRRYVPVCVAVVLASCPLGVAWIVTAGQKPEEKSTVNMQMEALNIRLKELSKNLQDTRDLQMAQPRVSALEEKEAELQKTVETLQRLSTLMSDQITQLNELCSRQQKKLEDLDFKMTEQKTVVDFRTKKNP